MAARIERHHCFCAKTHKLNSIPQGGMSAAHYDPGARSESLSCPEWRVREARAKTNRLDLEKVMHLRVANL
jgi:hypothetical protein